jgi:M6 family metalloprotease-like protein
MKTRRILALVLILLTLGTEMLPPQQAAAQDPSGGGSLEEKVMREAIQSLGWPDTIASQPMYMVDGDDDTLFMLWPPESAVKYLTKTKVSANNGGTVGENIQYARILALGKEGGQFYVDKFIENGFTASSYQGRPAAIVRSGQEMCGAGGLVGYLSKLISDWLEGIFGPNDAVSCPSAAAGYIAWTCGSHAFVARDDTGMGGEDTIAGALFAAAERQGLCDMGDTLVILAETNDVAGSKTIEDYKPIADGVNSYYGQNAYGKVSLSYTYVDYDGAEGNDDWYLVDANMTDFRGKETDFAIAAVQAAFEAGAPREELDLARVIVVHAGPSQQMTASTPNPAPLQTVCAWSETNKWHDITVGPPENQSIVHASSLIIVGETDGLGLWAHEVGHSLYGRQLIYGKYTSIGDRYNYQQPYGLNGEISAWGLMGNGNWWGTPWASDPVHMSAFSKENAGWLSYSAATLGENYSLAALETQGGAANALKVDDPTSADPDVFFSIEARQSGITYGAPESAVVVYKVSWDAVNKHAVVNNLDPQSGPTAGSAHGLGYDRPTLRNAGAADGVTVYRSVPERLEFTLRSEGSANGYSAVVSAGVYTPTNLVGATVAPTAAPAAAPPAVTTNLPGPLPDIDLHAWDDQGRHVGLDYATGQYVNEIPGAVASGDLRGDDEWIYVPEGTRVRYSVSAEKTRRFLDANPSYAAEAQPQDFEITYGRYDAEGNFTTADGGEGVVPAGIEANLSAPDDTALNYKPAPAVHYGRNWPADVPLLAFLAGILALGTVGWVTALVRR